MRRSASAEGFSPFDSSRASTKRSMGFRGQADAQRAGLDPSNRLQRPPVESSPGVGREPERDRSGRSPTALPRRSSPSGSSSPRRERMLRRHLVGLDALPEQTLARICPARGPGRSCLPFCTLPTSSDRAHPWASARCGSRGSGAPARGRRSDRSRAEPRRGPAAPPGPAGTPRSRGQRHRSTRKLLRIGGSPRRLGRFVDVSKNYPIDPRFARAYTPFPSLGCRSVRSPAGRDEIETRLSCRTLDGAPALSESGAFPPGSSFRNIIRSEDLTLRE